AGSDRTVRLWNAEDGAPVRVLRGHNDEVDCVEFAPDGETLVSCGNDGRILLWRPDLDAPIAEIGRRDCEVVAVLFTRDGKRVIAGDHAGVISVWDVAERRKLAEFRGGRGRIESLAITPDGRMLGVSSNPEPFRCFDLETYTMTREFMPDADSTRHNMSISFSSDGRYCAGSNVKGVVRVWNTESGDNVRSFFCSGTQSDSVIFGPGNAYVAFTARDSSVRVRSFATPHLDAMLRGHEGVVWNLAVAPDGKTLVSCGQDGTVRAWRPFENREDLHVVLDSAAEVAVAFNDDASRLVCVGEDGVVRITDAETGDLLSTRALASGAPIHSACVSDDARYIATADKNGTVGVWDAHDGRRLATLPTTKLASDKLKAGFSPDGVRLALEATAAGITTVWNWRTGAQEFERRSIAPAVNLKPQFSDDGKLVYTEDDELKLWDFEQRRGERLIRLSARDVELIAFNAEDHTAAIRDVQGRLTIWDRATGLQIGDAFMRKAGWNALAFSHRGGTLAATAYAHPVRFIDARTQVELGQSITNDDGDTARDFVTARDDSKLAIVLATHQGQVKYTIHSGLPAPAIATKLAVGAP
ncbi:MAG: WD40 repeat domain-containing protein, partial [Planctomycetota bacterium]|nr:WD40 repeat domain-containing protein [Planctomycetota bacterium]